MNGGSIDETTREYYGLPDAAGVIVTKVDKGTPAERAGLKEGDVIREVDGKKIKNDVDLISKISSRRPGDSVRLNVFRKGRQVEVAVTLGDRKEGLATTSLGEQAPPQPTRHSAEPESASGLGLDVESLSAEAQERLGFSPELRGVLVTGVDFDSEARKKGLVPDLLVTAINDKPVESINAWEKAVKQLSPGAPVKVDALAPGEERTYYFFLRVPQSKN
jgi:serine protease Do